MSIFKFEKGDIVRNTIKSHPSQSFFIYDSTVYESESFPSSSIASYGILTKDGTLSNFKTISTSSFNSSFIYGDTLTGPDLSFFSSSLARYYYAENGARSRVSGALKNTLEFYKVWSNHFSFSSSLGDKGTQKLSLINIPSLYYGSKVNKGSVNLKYYFTGTLAGELKDENKNGELIQVGPSGSVGSGSVAGVCLYNEGIIVLTGSWALTEEDDFDSYGQMPGSWTNFGAGIETDFSAGNLSASSFELSFEGVTRTPSMTLFCAAPQGMLNYSSNPTFIEYGQNRTPTSSSFSFSEPREISIKNIRKVPYNDPTGSFKKITYISKVHIYDENKNLLGIAKLSRPFKKTEDRDVTIKLKVDL